MPQATPTTAATLLQWEPSEAQRVWRYRRRLPIAPFWSPPNAEKISAIVGEEVMPVPLCPPYYVSADGNVYREYRNCVKKLKPQFQNGYPAIYVGIAGHQRHLYVHRMLLSAWAGDPPSSDFEVAHLDGNRSNCTLGNLAWVSHAENMRHAVLHQRTPRGDRHWKSKLTTADVRFIRNHSLVGTTHAQLAAQFGVHKKHISNIRSRQYWRWLDN